MTDTDRIKRLETAIERLCGALQRKDSELDGNWGWPPFNTEMESIKQYVRGELELK